MTQNYAYEVRCTSVLPSGADQAAVLERQVYHRCTCETWYTGVLLSSTGQAALLGRQAYNRCPMAFTTELQSEERQHTLHTFSSDCQKHTDLYSSYKAWLYGKFLT